MKCFSIIQLPSLSLGQIHEVTTYDSMKMLRLYENHFNNKIAYNL